MEILLSLFVKFYFMMTPPFILTVFLSMTKHGSKAEKKHIVIKLTAALFLIGIVILLFGKYIFMLFGITLDAFRIGAGTILFLSALQMLKSADDVEAIDLMKNDISVVPLAIPFTLGPGLIGVLMVIGAEANGVMDMGFACFSYFLASCALFLTLLMASRIESLLGPQGLEILPKLTGLFVSAIGAQIIFTGIKGFLL